MHQYVVYFLGEYQLIVGAFAAQSFKPDIYTPPLYFYYLTFNSPLFFKPLLYVFVPSRGKARGRGANRPGRRVERAPMKITISTKLLFYRIILVYFSKKSVLIDVLAPPHWQKTDTIFQK